jgi:hypothetical protein
VEFQFGAIAEGLESQNLQLFEFKQSNSLVGGPCDPRLGWRWLECAANCGNRGLTFSAVSFSSASFLRLTTAVNSQGSSPVIAGQYPLDAVP